MASPEENLNIGRRRATRVCTKKTVYVDSQSSDEGNVMNDSADQSFCIDTENNKERPQRKKAKVAAKKPPRKTAMTKTTATTRKRGAKNKADQSNMAQDGPSLPTIKMEQDGPSSPTKKMKMEQDGSSLPTKKMMMEQDGPSLPTKKIKTEYIPETVNASNSNFAVPSDNINQQFMGSDQSPINVKEESKPPLDQFCQQAFQITGVGQEISVHQLYETASQQPEKLGDWICEKCKGNNYQWRTVCFRCKTAKIIPSGNTNVGLNWICISCHGNNYPWRKDCFRCRTEKPYVDNQKIDTKPVLNNPSTSYSSSNNCSNLSRGDWTCINCNSNNFPWRKDCFKCRNRKPNVDNNQSGIRPLFNNPSTSYSSSNNCSNHVKADWICVNCSNNNFSWRRQCFRCQYDKPQCDSSANKPQLNKIEEVSKCDIPENCQSLIPSSIKDEKEDIDWFCGSQSCATYNSSWRKECFVCQAPNSKNCPTDIKVEIQPAEENETKKKSTKKGTVKKEKVQKSPTKKAKSEKETTKKVTAKIESSVVEDDNLLSIKKKFNVTSSTDSNEHKLTRECQLISKKSNIPFNIVHNVINLFNSEATVPFIVRYRSHLIGGLSAEEVRVLKQRYESTKKLVDKADKMKVKLESLGYLDEALSCAIDSCVTQQELDYLNEPFKVLKSSKLVKVIDMGLSTPSDNILYGRGIIHLEQFVREDLNLTEVNDLIIYYVGEMMSKDSHLMDRVRELMKSERIFLTTKQKKATTSKKAAEKQPKKNRPEDIYSNYYSFSSPYDRVKPHQILAINRGESENCLQVVLDVPDNFQFKITHFARTKWYFKGIKYDLREYIFNKALDFMYNKRVCPYVKRQIRTELTKQGEKASLEVFSSNLKYLLLTQPVRNVTVCAVDPGFTHGCKLAILNPQQEVLTTSVLYLENPEHFDFNGCTFVRLINDYNIDLLVVGNGKGCRDVEIKISKLIDNNQLKRTLKYVVASENGISVYSCSSDATEEYPNTSPNIISAISLAKRIQDPLCELVKVEPKHLGVGMYQHDINEKKLDSVLDDVVSECVSIVGVDVNNAPLRILKRVAGLSESKAKTIIETREKKGSFINREDLKNVKGIGPKTFQQCAGFIKIIPGTYTKTKVESKSCINHLDQTIVHPEDYISASKVLEMNNLISSKIGTSECIDKLKMFMQSQNWNNLATKLNVPFETLKLILEALTTPLDYDIRSTFDKPLFRNKATSIEDLALNSVVSGRVENVTHFGAFVDLGVECNGLIYTSKLKGRDLHLGQIVKVQINEIDTNKMRIGLSLVDVV